MHVEFMAKGNGKEVFIATFDYAFGEFSCKTLVLETQKETFHLEPWTKVNRE